VSLDGYLLAIDPSTACGFAVLRPDGSRVISGTWQLKRNGDGAGARFVRVQEYLDKLLVAHPTIVHVAYELPGRFDTQAAYLAVYGIATHVESWCERAGLPYCAFAPSEVKRAAGCKGNADKTAVAAAIASRFDIELLELGPDEADALACGLAGLVELGCIPPLVLTAEAPAKRKTKQTDEQLVDDFCAETQT
jgi:Holliday junction resolvasome RuvABC endonuclease subunit